MNGEEDLGISGLRMMKKHLGPQKCTEIWRAKKKGGYDERERERSFYRENAGKTACTINGCGNRTGSR